MNDRNLTRTAAALALALAISGHVRAQQTAAPAGTPPAPTTGASASTIEEDEGEMIVLTPFEVRASSEGTYTEGSTLAGNRLASNLRDLGNAVSVINTQFLRDTGATNNETLLQYTVGTEVGNVYGNYAGTGNGSFLDESNRFTNPNQNTRVRGLAAADNSRDYFLSDVPWDGSTIDRVDLQRGPNSILFGLGSPAGVINSGTKQASYRNSAEAEVRFGSFGTVRTSLDINRALLKDELAVRFVALREDEKFKQKPAYEQDERLFAAIRYEPSFLKLGSARTVIKGNIESGDIESNRPRSLPPVDYITPWFYTGTTPGNYTYNPTTQQWTSTRNYANLNRGTFIPSQLQDDNTGRPNHGQMRPMINGGPNAGQPNPAYQPWLGNFAQQFGGPMAYFDSNSSTMQGVYRTWEPTARYAINSLGQRNPNGIGGIPYQRPGSVAPYATFARNARLPWSDFGIYKDRYLRDASVFDFYNNLIDGPNKEEWQEFTVYNLSLTQTFFNDKMGFEVARNAETYRNGQLQLLAGGRQGIYIDVNSVYSDGTPNGLNGEPHADGTPNPNVGRPFISDNGQFGNNSYLSDRGATRVTAFVTHDFARDSDNFFLRLLGKHTVTGLWADDQQETDRRAWQRYGTGFSWERWNASNNTLIPFTDNVRLPNTVIYLGPSLLNSSSASGAKIPRPTAKHVLTSGQIRAFDSTWNSTVNPADPWFNNYYPVGMTAGEQTQSQNPANYVGYRNIPLEVIDSEAAPGNRDYLTREARLTKSEVESKAVFWQGHLLDRAIVGTFGYRDDEAKSWQHQQTTNSPQPYRYADGRLNLDPTLYRLPTTPTTVRGNSTSWMGVVHINQLPGLAKATERLPINVSAFFNKSSNFQPAANRVDLYGQPLSAPSGETTDYGILIATKDGRYSLKVNRYETEVINATSTALGGAWFIGASQAWSGNWVNRFEFNWTQDTNAGAVAVNDPTNSQYNYAPAPGETLEQAQVREANVIAAWRAWQNSVDPRFYQAWNINLNDPTRSITATVPQGFSVTEDAISKGYEFELSGNPLRNWRISVNASKTRAIRNNIGGTLLREFVANYENALRTTPAGDLRIWWGGAGNETALFQWNNNIGSEYAQRRLQEGTEVPELREWRVNAITNYDFSTGWLRNVNVGAGIRYQSDVIIGHPPIFLDNGNVSFDLSRPYKGPAETDFDFWIGYRRRLWEKVDWNIQLNVRNVGNGNALIPINVQPDGGPAGYRIQPPQTWTLTNTFKF